MAFAAIKKLSVAVIMVATTLCKAIDDSGMAAALTAEMAAVVAVNGGGVFAEGGSGFADEGG
jgi:hypothetical protein